MIDAIPCPTGPTSYAEIIDNLESRIYDLTTANARLLADKKAAEEKVEKYHEAVLDIIEMGYSMTHGADFADQVLSRLRSVLDEEK